MGRRRRQPPSGLEGIRGRLEKWRKTRPTRSIPDDLWEEAASLARAHGVHPIARALRLNYDSLKERASRRARRRKAKSKETAALFAELEAVSGSGPECTIELEARGEKLTIRLRGAADIDLVGLTSAFWRRRR